jgi:hypothetical protein
MEAVRVKVYGLFTKRSYLICQVIGFTLAVAILVAAFTLDLRQLLFPSGRMTLAQRWLLDNLVWVILATMVLEVGETVFTLRRFAQKEALARATPAAEQP